MSETLYKILIVDDSDSYIQMISEILRSYDLAADTALSGQKAIDLMRKNTYELVLLDIVMPGLNGLETLKKIKEDPSLKDVPVIMVSARVNTANIVAGFEAGAIDFIAKPFISQEFIARLRTHLNLALSRRMLKFEIVQRKSAQEQLGEFTKVLEKTNQQLQVTATRLYDQSQELALARDELSTSNQKLAEANATKDRVFSIIAHDLRGPISSISNTLSLVLNNLLDMQADREVLVELDKSAKSTYNLLENLLYWARSQRGQIRYEPSDIILSHIVEDNIELLGTAATNKGITLQNQVEPNVKVLADENLLQTILRNLINNAIKFTHAGDSITVSAKQDGKMLRISVTDTGVGISSENLSKLFDKNQPITTFGTDREKGTGLGLMLCKEFVERCGGELAVHSSLGKGSEFYFSLPLVN